MKTEYKIISYNLSVNAISKLDELSDTLGRSRSAIIERIIMNATEKTLIKYAKRNPDYSKGSVNNDSEI